MPRSTPACPASMHPAGTRAAPWAALALLASVAMTQAQNVPTQYNVRAHGATGTGQTLDTEAINKTIEAAAAAGGGTVYFPAGTYLSHSIRLKSNIALYIDQGATLLAADAPAEPGQPGYDAAEPNEWTMYQDFGHSHWHNSLIWGENLENITIAGPGLIFGRGLTRTGPGPTRRGGRGAGAGDMPGSLGGGPAVQAQPAPEAPGTPGDAPAAEGGRGGGRRGGGGGGQGATRAGVGNKAIALKNCRNVTFKDFSMLQCGHFAILATGVDNFTIDNVKVDTNRDGFDIDSCRNVRVSNCSVNSPNDDAIVLKSSYALGFARACENVTIINCQVTGYDPGTFLDGTFQRTQERAPDRDGPTGRIKLGTESNGGFKNITIANCVFDRSRGLCLETVDGGVIEDITVSNLAMREITSSPIFLRLGHRARAPEGTPVGAIRRVNISNVVASGVDAKFPILLAGIPDHPIEDVTLSDIRIVFKGGLTIDDVAQQPSALVNGFFGNRGAGGGGGRNNQPPTQPRNPYQPPEQITGYPEPSMFGLLPAYGLYARHVKNLVVRDVDLRFEQTDARAPIVLFNVAEAEFIGLKTQRAPNTPVFVAEQVSELTVRDTPGSADAKRAQITAQETL